MTSDLNTRTESVIPAGRLHQTAELIADGELPIPVDWPEESLSPLLDLVHAARRRRLVRYIARVIAGDICRHDRQKD